MQVGRGRPQQEEYLRQVYRACRLLVPQAGNLCQEADHTQHGTHQVLDILRSGSHQTCPVLLELAWSDAQALVLPEYCLKISSETEEELAKENDKGPEPTEKQKRKMVLKEKRKERQAQGIEDFWGRHRLVGKMNKYDKGKKFQRMVYEFAKVAMVFSTCRRRRMSIFGSC